MPEITIYTNDGDCANGVAEINPFTEGDATDEWTLKFNNGTNFYSPSNVTMRVGHTNGLPDGTYNNAFKWIDRTNNSSQVSISVSAGVPSATFSPAPLGGVIGSNGVNILRGPLLDGRILGVDIIDKGNPYWFYGDTNTRTAAVTGDATEKAIVTYGKEADASVNLGSNTAGKISYIHHQFADNTDSATPRKWTDVTNVTSSNSARPGSAKPTLSSGQLNSFENIYDGRNLTFAPSNGGTLMFSDITGSIQGTETGSGSLASSVRWIAVRSKLGSISISNAGSGYETEPVIEFFESAVTQEAFTGIQLRKPTLSVRIAKAQYEVPFKREESGNNIIAATTLSPYSDGQITGAAQYDHSTLVIRPETVATASLAQSGTDWVGTMNPINAYTTARLALRNSTQLDLQIRGDGRTLFQGQLTILNKIA